MPRGKAHGRGWFGDRKGHSRAAKVGVRTRQMNIDEDWTGGFLRSRRR